MVADLTTDYSILICVIIQVDPMRTGTDLVLWWSHMSDLVVLLTGNAEVKMKHFKFPSQLGWLANILSFRILRAFLTNHCSLLISASHNLSGERTFSIKPL